MTLISVAGGAGMLGSWGGHETVDSAESYLKHVSLQIEQTGLKVDYVVERGQPDRVISAMSRDMGADLIVMTTHGRSAIEKLFISDVAERTLRAAQSPVLLIRPTEEWHSRRTRFQRLLVCLDGSGCAESALRYARRLAEEFHGEIILLGVPESDLEKTQLLQYMKKVARALRGDHITATAMVTGSGPARTIVELTESEDIDLVILTRSGRGSSERHAALGSVANRVSQTTQRPLLLIGGSEACAVGRML